MVLSKVNSTGLSIGISMGIAVDSRMELPWTEITATRLSGMSIRQPARAK
jgi:hypothetical protein